MVEDKVEEPQLQVELDDNPEPEGHVYGQPVIPGSPLAKQRAALDASRARNTAQRNLNRFFEHGSLYSWGCPSKEVRHRVAAGLEVQAQKRKEGAERIRGRLQDKAAALIQDALRQEVAEPRGEKVGPVKPQTPFRQWSAEDVAAVLDIFFEFDEDASGFIDEKELQALSSALMVDVSVAEADTFVKDGLIDAKEFFAFYTGCSRQEAEHAFASHGWGG